MHPPKSLLDSFLSAVPFGVALFDRDMRYLFHNERWLLDRGEPGDRSLIGLSHYEVFQIPEHWRAAHRRCLAGAVERSERDLLVRSDGVREYMRWGIAPWRDMDGEIGGLVIYTDKITEQVRNERRLAEQETLLQGMFAHSPVGINLCRLDGLWLESNPAFLDIIGYTQEEADGGLTYWQLTPRKYDAEEAAQLESLRVRGRYGPYEKELIRKDGRHVPVRLNGFLIEREGEQLIWSLIEDLTAQRELEAELEEERLKAIQTSKLAMLGEMAASFAHEINNPLSIIDGNAFIAQEALESGDKEAVIEALEAIRSAVQRTGQIVHRLSRFARQEAPLPPEELSLTEVLREAIELCRPRLRSGGVALDVEAHSDVQIHGHPIEIAQVFVNLLNNAYDAAQLAYETSATRRWIRVSVAERPRWVDISVEDSGAGVPQSIAVDIFRPFFTTKPPGSGTGLGLSVSRNIVERHGGSLALDETSLQTRFVVSLPR